VAKGHRGQTCAEALRSAMGPGEVLTASELFERVRAQGSWKDGTIWQHMMSTVMNLPPARRHWPWRQPFLFLRGDGRYELYSAAKHPAVIE
jgi:hypothetical protein